MDGMVTRMDARMVDGCVSSNRAGSKINLLVINEKSKRKEELFAAHSGQH